MGSECDMDCKGTGLALICLLGCCRDGKCRKVKMEKERREREE